MIGRARAKINRRIRLSDEIAAMIVKQRYLSTEIVCMDEAEAKAIFERVPKIVKSMVEFEARRATA